LRNLSRAGFCINFDPLINQAQSYTENKNTQVIPGGDNVRI